MVEKPVKDKEPIMWDLPLPVVPGNGYGGRKLSLTWWAFCFPPPLFLNKFFMAQQKEMVCVVCGNVGKLKSETPGSMVIELILWLFFIIPGLIYSFWRLSSRKMVCAVCGSPNMVPVDSPRGKKLISE